MDELPQSSEAEVCPDPYPPELPERLWRAYVAEWGTAIRYLGGVPGLLADLSAGARVGAPRGRAPS